MLTPSGKNRATEIYKRALAKPPAVREHYVHKMCGDDDDLRQRVQQLLERDQTSLGDYGGDPALMGSLQLHEEFQSQEIGRILGGYELVERLTREAAFSTYLARRVGEELRVVIKWMHDRCPDSDFSARGRHEIQRQAAVDRNPQIAILLDAGLTEEGTPFFVMQGMDGIPIDLYCDQHRLDVLKRICLFSQVCEVVHFAHEQSLLHRSLEPASIRVADDGKPWLANLGIATLLEPPADPENVEKDTGSFPVMDYRDLQYASPEQHRGEPLTVATDIYSLGLVLHKLLTGQVPYQLKPPLPSDFVRRGVHSVRPSSGDAITDRICEVRRTTRRRLEILLRGDLDHILLKALEESPENRYVSAQQMSYDLRRYKDGRPVIARPNTAGYRARKFLKRNRSLLWAAVFTAFAIGWSSIGFVELQASLGNPTQSDVQGNAPLRPDGRDHGWIVEAISSHVSWLDGNPARGSPVSAKLVVMVLTQGTVARIQAGRPPVKSVPDAKGRRSLYGNTASWQYHEIGSFCPSWWVIDANRLTWLPCSVE